MQLTDEQKASVTQWVQAGRSLADVQRALLEEFEISMTYMDVRFLVDDLDIAVVEDEPEAGEDAADAETENAEAELVDEGGDGSVFVDVDAIMRPGALVSGTVKFSDGVSLGWQLSAAGQLGLIPGDDPEYRPSPEDVQSFQAQLEEVLRKKGF
ncbi:hypothetical protein QEH59_01930 [Coraliomargarita sp. SDUM461004]|uniref:Uncharacterized protein n=1 Tax=Thalassobacterium sedimentorum TaxID=3041258 RepID=A0ABU1AEI2_9BACT|nr:hypothetical protein [Coraliomargarita sp. SDUM461004]MDQ8193167.1 hypothetical protein [Coraliomargarita sp. SDUM461004]